MKDCEAITRGDQNTCTRCGTCWDINDQDPPECKPRRKAEKPETVKARGLSFRERAAASGQVRREYYATPEEHDKLKAVLKKLRK